LSNLPALNVCTYNLTLPSDGQKIKYRQYLIKEEKLLLMAKEGDSQSMISAIINLAESCCLTKGIQFANRPLFDLEYFFINLKKVSVGEISEVLLYENHINLKDKKKQCDPTPVQLDLNKVKVYIPEGHSNEIMITDQIGVKMKYLKFSDITQNDMNTENVKVIFDLIYNSLEMIFDRSKSGDEGIFLKENMKKEDVIEWLEGFNQEQFAKLAKFFETTPRIQLKVSYTCKDCGKKK
jgi:hypothetical protein